jgi:hypothetical protein
MTRNQSMFYATAKDIAVVLSTLESQKGLEYTRTGQFDASKPQTYRSYIEIRNLGMASHPTAIANPSYLVSLRGTPIRARRIIQNTGKHRFAFDQRLNEDTVALSPGGRYGSDIILYGMIGTVSDTAVSISLYKFMVNALRERFDKIDEFFVGPEALQLGKAGFRLTDAVSTTSEFDLKLR